MITEWDVYTSFRRAQAIAKDKPYRLPKNWESFKLKMSKQNDEWLYKATVWFNTKYVNIDIDEYMLCGFELWKGFTYKHFCDSRVINLYIEKDKIKKRKMQITHEEIDKSFVNIENWLKDQPLRSGYTQLQNLCKFREGEIRCVIGLYNRGLVDTMTLTYCLNKRYLIMSDDERLLMPYISQRYRELQESLLLVKGYINQKEIELDERARG